MRYRTLGLPSWCATLVLASIAVGAVGSTPPKGVDLQIRPKPIGEDVPALPFPQGVPSRITPLAVHVVAGGEGVGDAGALADRDTETAAALSGVVTLGFDLEHAASVSGLRVFGHPDLTLSVSYTDGTRWLPAAGLQQVAAGELAPGWNDLAAASPFTTSALRVELAAPSGAPFPEIEIWGLGGVPVVPGDASRLLPLEDGRLPDALRAFEASTGEVEIANDPVTVSVDVPRTASHFRRAYLVYELRGLSSWRAVPRSINGRPKAGGTFDTPAQDWSRQIERINPDWLRQGGNTITFEPAAGALPYAVRGVRLLAELDTGANAVERVVSAEEDLDRAHHPAVDGDASTSWTPALDGEITMALDRTIEPSALGLLLGAKASGTLEAQAIAEDGGVAVLGSWRGDDLEAGWNFLPLDPGHAAARLRVVLLPGVDVPWSVVELLPVGSGVGRRAEPPTLSVVWPGNGEFQGREAYIRGFASLPGGGSAVPRITVGGTVVEAEDGAFGVTVFKDELGYWADEDAATWAVTVEAAYPDGRILRRTVRLTRSLAAPESVEGALLGGRTFPVRPDQARKLRHDGASLDLEEGSLRHPTDVKMTPLKLEDLPGLDLGMTNVTRGPRRGYRFEPHGTRFLKNVRVSLPYDPQALPEGMTEEDVHTYYFDEQTGRWQALQRVEVDTAARTIVSLTDHFTDMVNGTLAIPDQPGPFAHDPTIFAKVPPADPAERIVLIDSPKASSVGDARVSYPLDLPPGRKEMTPDLSLDYLSSAGNGWVGVGWSLAVPSLAVDTRWGSPRFDPALETETYTLSGEQLTPLAHREALEARSAEKTFHLRREGRFARIVRHGSDPASYWWEVTDKDGVVSLFGGAPGTALADDQGRISRWLLRERRDLHGNAITYAYARVDDTGLPAGTVPGHQLYLSAVRYTEFPGDPGAFTVRFVRDGELGEPRRPDVTIDARGGFKEVTSELLRRVQVEFQGGVVRSWELAYARGAFEKTLLQSVTQRGADGSVLAAHRFAYHDDVRQDDAYVGFAPTEGWSAGSDGVRSPVVDELASLFGSDAGRATALSGYQSTHAGGHLYAGFNFTSPTKQGSAGGKVGFTGSVSSEGLLALVDLNGDQLPDKLFRGSGGIAVRLNRSGPGGTPDFGPAHSIPSLPAISEESVSIFSAGGESYVAVSAIGNVATGITSARVYLADVNGDGLTDLVNGGTVLFNRLDAAGIPTFDPDSGTSPVPVGPGSVDAGLLPDYGPEVEEVLASAPLHDTLRRWVAPYAGQVRITGDVSLSAPPPGTAADGVRVAIQHNGAEAWTATSAAGDTTPVAPTGVDAVPVAKGDRIYFRVQSRAEGSHDAVAWDPEIAYVGAPAVTDANGLNPWRFRASEDFVFAGRPGMHVKLPFTGRVRLTGDLQKTGVTTDAVTLLVFKNDAQVYADGLQWDETGTIQTGIAFDVAQDDTLELRVRVDSPIDLRKIVWVPALFYEGPPDAPAPTHTVDGTTATIDRVTDAAGNPIIQLHPAYHVDFYPVDELAAPQQPWVSDVDGTVTVSSHLTAAPEATGVVFMTVKRRGALAAKRTIFIVDGVVQNRVVDIEVEEDEELFFDYSCLDPDLAPLVGNRIIEVDGDEVPTVFRTTHRQAVFPLAYRGWSVAGYNGTAPRDGQPIVESDFERTFDEESTLDPRTEKVYLFTPFAEDGVWRGPEEETVVSAAGAASSRLGPNAVPIPGEGSTPGRAPVRLSTSLQVAAELGVGFLSGSLSGGSGGSDLDFQDMNGDRFPDVVGRAEIQYSPALGGLEPQGRALSGFEAPRKSDSTAENVGVGGSPANFRVGSRGHVDTPGRGAAAKENDTRPQMVALGLSGSLGSGSSSVPYDLVDLNGDGLPDRVLQENGALRVAFNLGYAFAAPEPWGMGALADAESASLSIGTNLGFNGGIYDFAGGLSLGRNASETTAMLSDLNGDGLPDRLVRDGDALRVGLNTGTGFLPLTEWGGAPQGAFATSRDATAGAGAYFTVGIGPLCFGGCYVILNPGIDGSTSLARQEAALLDLDGDGYPDHVTSTDDASLTVARNTTGRTNLLRRIERPLGAVIDIDYVRDGNTPDLPQSRWTLSRVSIHDGLPGDGVDVQLATFRYENGAWDRLEREFYGYGRVVEEVRDASQGEAIYRTITREFGVDSFYTRGTLLRERMADAAGRPFLETEHTYEALDAATLAPIPDRRSTTATAFPALLRTDRRFFEGQPAAGKTSFATQEFGAFGNVVRSFDAGDEGPQDDLEAIFAYASCPTTHVVGIPVAMTVRGNGTELRRRQGVLDCATGNLTRITEYLADGTGADTDMSHDALGNLVRVVGPPNHRGQRYTLEYEYDPLVQTHIARTTDSFGYVSVLEWDVAQGRRILARDPAGNDTTYTYDTHGRLTVMRGPYEQSPGTGATILVEHHPEAAVPWSRTRHLDTFRDPGDPVDTVRFVDGLKRVVQEKTDASVHSSVSGAPSTVMTVSGRVTFDAVGREIERYYPTVELPGTPGVFRATYDPVTPTRTTFDVQDRPVVVHFPDGTETSSLHGFGQNQDGVTQFQARNLDANGVPTLVYRDVRDLVTGQKDENRIPGGVQEIWTSFGYDALQRLTRITDDLGNVTRVVWDNLGRKVAVDSPDMGRSEEVFDLAGNRMARETANLRARGRQIRYDYQFNRLEGIVYPDFPGNGVTYVYGPPGAPANLAGRLQRIVDPSGVRVRAYGKLGEVISEVRTIASLTPGAPEIYTTQYTYDSFARLQRLTYPDGEVLTFRYDSGGKLHAVAGRKGPYDYSYLNRMEYDKFGDHAFVEAGNGTQTTYTHRPDNRRLERVLAVRPGGGPFVNLTYVYDAVGNVLTRTSVVPVATGSDFGGPTQQTFAYDDLDRMVLSRGTYEFAPNKTDRYVVTFDYDTIHNMRSRNQLHEVVQPSGSTVRQGKTSYAFAYAYAGPRPHAVTQVGGRSFSYDANGNQAGWQDDQNGTRRQIVWDEENRMHSLTDNGHEIRFVYDDMGERVIKRGPQGETVYVNPWLTMRNRTGGTKHVWAGAMRIASKLMKQDRPGGNPSGEPPLEKDRYFYHQDHAGTTNFVTDATGKLYEHLEYFPFGETWVQESSNTQRTPYAFTGKELDEETALAYLGARYHDPRVGGFNSGEPLLYGSPEKSRDEVKFLSVYSYANHNPERFLDPDGEEVIILVGQPGDQKYLDNQKVKRGYPAAAKAFQAMLKSQKIESRIVNMSHRDKAKLGTKAALEAAAADIKAKGGKVSGTLYIGHGDPKTGLIVPEEKGVSLSARQVVDASGIRDNGVYGAWGCEVSVGKDVHNLKGRGISVLTTHQQWTYTTVKGRGALGTKEKEQTSYGNLWDFRLSNVTMGIDLSKADIHGGKTLGEAFVEAENTTK